MPTYQADNTRIARNTILLYFRMLLMMVISLYTSRVILQTLGVEDYGIYSVVGGIVTMFSFINAAMTTSTQRFLTFELGKGNPQRLRDVFNTSIQIHLIISAVIVLLSETAGLWFLWHKMVIPAERMDAAFWCFQLSIFTAVVNIMSYPYNAAIIAHEKMSAFAYISILDAILKLLLVYLLLVFSFDRLILYAILFAIEKLLIRSIYNMYCTRHFEECNVSLTCNKPLFREMMTFAGWSMCGNLACVLYSQGLDLLLNVFFGPVVNAARAIAVQVQSATSSLASNFQMAINPQITKTYSSGQMEEMHKLVLRSSRFTFCLLFILCCPIILNAEEILWFWLGNVPEHAVGFLRIILSTMIVESMANPLVTAVSATGKIKKYQITMSLLLFMILPVSYVTLQMGGAPWVVFSVHQIVILIAFAVRLLIVSPLISLSIVDYFKSVITRCMATLIASAFVVYLYRRVCICDYFIVNAAVHFAVCGIFCTLLGLDNAELKSITRCLLRK